MKDNMKRHRVPQNKTENVQGVPMNADPMNKNCPPAIYYRIQLVNAVPVAGKMSMKPLHAQLRTIENVHAAQRNVDLLTKNHNLVLVPRIGFVLGHTMEKLLYFQFQKRDKV
jgi:hypothetical protein